MRKLKPIHYLVPETKLPSILDELGGVGRWFGPTEETLSTTRVYFDSFEWGLFEKNLLLYREGNQLFLHHAQASSPKLSIPLRRDPIWPEELPTGALRDEIVPLCEFRRLFAVLNCQVETRKLALQDELEKTILRLEVRHFSLEDGQESLSQVSLLPLRGYDDALVGCRTIFENQELRPRETPLGIQLFNLAGRDTRPHKKRLKIKLNSETTLHEALCQQLLLLQADMEHHREGIIEDWDTEFVHQFRIAVRRSRSLLSYFRKDLPDKEVAFASEMLRTWGQRTNPLRDLDVLLLDREHYEGLLPEEIRPHLGPFFAHLNRRRKRVRRELVQHLTGQDYDVEMKALVNAFQHTSPAPLESARMPLPLILQTRLRRRLKKLRALLIKCIAGVPEEQLHRLRIQFKKLRYILVTFEALFPPKTLKTALGHLKRCQKVLGERHDMEWQRETLLEILAQKKPIRLPGETTRAIAMLAGVIHARHHNQWPQVQQGLRDLEAVSFKELLVSLDPKQEGA